MTGVYESRIIYTMGMEKDGKLNRLQRELPEGLLVDSRWLAARGYTAQHCQKYVSHGWLERPARGVFRRPGGPLSWQAVVISLQTLLQQPLLVGGRSSLALQGYEHYVSMQERDVHLYGPEPAPGWLSKLPLGIKFLPHNSRALFTHTPTPLGPERPEGTVVGGSDPKLGAVKALSWGQWNWPILVSTPERAFLEMLNDLPDHGSFDIADKTMESLSTLRPRVLQALLADCKSIKVKRLFFFFADRQQHAWLKRLDKEAIDLGTGKRMLVRGGRLDPTYLITVPETLYGVQ